MKYRDLTYDVAGEQTELPPIVLVHGVAGSRHIWDPVFDELSCLRQVVRFDLLGYGHSPKPKLIYSPDVHVDVIRRTLGHLGLKPPYVLMGLSMGSTLVLEYAKQYPTEIDRLLLIGYPYYRDVEHAKTGLRNNVWAGLTIDHPRLASIYIPAVWWLGRVGILPPRLFAGIYTPLQAHETLLCPYRVFRSNVQHSMIDVDADALITASAALPRLFLHGEQDEWSDAAGVERAVTAAPRTEFVLVPKAGHNLVVLEPESVLANTSRFLEK